MGGIGGGVGVTVPGVLVGGGTSPMATTILTPSRHSPPEVRDALLAPLS